MKAGVPQGSRAGARISVEPTGEDARSRSAHSQKKEKKPVTIRLDVDVIDYFKAEADRTGIPYQNLINLYLQDCVDTGKTLCFA